MGRKLRYFLDTHILVWWLEDPTRLSQPQRDVLQNHEQNRPFGVSDVTLLEIAGLVGKGRLSFNIALQDWLQRACSPPLVKLCRIDAAGATATLSLPSSFPRDPADRIIVTTARLLGCTLLTRDGLILASGALDTLG